MQIPQASCGFHKYIVGFAHILRFPLKIFKYHNPLTMCIINCRIQLTVSGNRSHLVLDFTELVFGAVSVLKIVSEFINSKG